MRTAWRRVGAFSLSLVVPLVGCSDDDVTFPPNDASVDGTMDTGVDTAPRPDVSTDAGADLSSDPRVDTTPDDVRPDFVPPDSCCGPDRVEPDASDANGTDSIDVTGVDERTDAPSPDADAPVDAADAADALSEEAGPPTCESRCASGVCDMNGNCTPCVKDDECTAGKVCNAGTCGPRCGDGGVACPGNLVCCTEHCVDTTRDPNHCGACATSCAANQFCGNASTPVCKETLLRNLCDTKKATFLLDGLTDDDVSSGVIKNAIAALCAPPPTMVSVDQSVSTAINNTTGQPLVGGGEMLVAAGGDSTQLLVRYLETSRTASVYNESDGVTQLRWMRRGGAADGGDSVVATVDLNTVTETNDYFLAEVVRDPISGTFSLIVYGIDSPGTRAGAYYFANVILPKIVGDAASTVTQGWYIYRWTSAGPADAGPSMADTFTEIASGM